MQRCRATVYRQCLATVYILSLAKLRDVEYRCVQGFSALTSIFWLAYFTNRVGARIFEQSSAFETNALIIMHSATPLNIWFD